MEGTLRSLPILVVLCGALVGCRGKLLATAYLAGPGTAEAHFTAGAPVELWSDSVGTWLGPEWAKLPLHYDIDVTQSGKLVGRASCDTDTEDGTSVCGVESNAGGRHHGDCEVHMICDLPKLAPGDVTLKVTGRIADPSRVKSLTLMSLNVREK